FNLLPTRFRSNVVISGIAAEESILFVVEPDEAEFVLGIHLKVASQVGICLVIDVVHWRARLVRHRENPLVQVVTAIRTEEPPLVPHERATETGGSVSSHVERRAGDDRTAVVNRSFDSSLERGRQIVNSGLSVQFV